MKKGIGETDAFLLSPHARHARHAGHAGRGAAQKRCGA
jgi:hypothetical protein